ncbi:MAG TPA: S-layer homology domain-containing protein, partial [Aminivibrio sp.]|nr:S-layer homology domain-containing protein [Aminivibrio sp.]
MKKLVALVAVAVLVAFAAPALAANPFMDVPMNHWAYDAISQLSAQGIVSGYPDGTFKGNAPMTRYEMASIVARALAVVDMNKASKQDVEMLKRLVVEFKDELDALGVKVDELDSRVAVLEENLGGWKFWGEFRFDAKFSDDDLYTSDEVDFTQSRYRLWYSKVVDDKVTFIGRVTGSDLAYSRYYIDVKLPYDFTMWAGLWFYDWEDAKGLYNDNDAWFGDQALEGFYFTRPFSMGNFSFYVAHADNKTLLEVVMPGDDDDDDDIVESYAGDYFRYGLDVNFNPTENLRVGMGGTWFAFESLGTEGFDVTDFLDIDGSVYQADLTYNFTPDIAFKGAYYMENLPGDVWDGPLDDSPSAWKAILDISQKAFGFTSVWIEYASFDPEFFLVDFAGCDSDGNGPWDNYGAAITPGLGFTYSW